MKKPALTIRLDTPTINDVKSIAKDKGISQGAFIDSLVKKYKEDQYSDQKLFMDLFALLSSNIDVMEFGKNTKNGFSKDQEKVFKFYNETLSKMRKLPFYSE